MKIEGTKAYYACLMLDEVKDLVDDPQMDVYDGILHVLRD